MRLSHKPATRAQIPFWDAQPLRMNQRIPAAWDFPTRPILYMIRTGYFLMDIRAYLRNGLRPKPSALRAAIAVCLVVLLLLGAFHVAIAHSISTDTDHCPICLVMHSVLPFLVMVVAVLLARVGIAAPVLLDVRPIVQYRYPKLFTRPPPALG